MSLEFLEVVAETASEGSMRWCPWSFWRWWQRLHLEAACVGVPGVAGGGGRDYIWRQHAALSLEVLEAFKTAEDEER